MVYERNAEGLAVPNHQLTLGRVFVLSVPRTKDHFSGRFAVDAFHEITVEAEVMVSKESQIAPQDVKEKRKEKYHARFGSRSHAH